MKPKTRQTLLIVIMVVVTLLVFRTYLPVIQLPTQARVEEKLRELKSLRGDLGVARKTYEDRVAMIEGVPQLYGAPVTASDLRAGAALVVAGLMAQGTTEIYEPEYIDRGYENLDQKLCAMGAEIRREAAD